MMPLLFLESSSHLTAAALIFSSGMLPQSALLGAPIDVSSENAQEPVVAVEIVYGSRLIPPLSAYN